MTRIWLLLCLGWTVSSADRAVTGPVVTWMIRHKVAFMAAPDPYALGGLIGSIFFAGYMLAQFPGGYAGDRNGHRSVIVISLAWAALATLLSGLAGALAAFMAVRIFTGLGEGIYYANDRAVIAETTPPARRSLGMGVVITGLSIGITLAIALTPVLIDFGAAVLGEAAAWRMPFFALSAVSAVIACVVWRGLAPTRTRQDRPWRALAQLAPYAAVFFALTFGLFVLARALALPPWAVTLVRNSSLAFGTIRSSGGEKARKFRARSAAAIWCCCMSRSSRSCGHCGSSVSGRSSIVAQASGGSFQAAAMTAMFTGLSGVVGYPAGGWLADWTLRAGIGRKPVLIGFTRCRRC